MAPDIIKVLTGEIEEIFGRKILTSRDCIDISEDISQKFNERVHTNTLRRFFGVVNSPFQPSSSTLNILARYCGFDCIDDIPRVQKNIGPDTNAILESEILHYFYSFFKNTEVDNINDGVFLSQVRHTIDFISRNEHLADKLHKLIARTKNGQQFYFEQFINIDKLDSYYGDGLRYYAKEKKTDEGRIFAHSLLVFRYWLTMDKKNLEKHWQHLNAYQVDESTQPLIASWYFASQLYYTVSAGRDTDPVLIKAQKIHADLKQAKDDCMGFPCFELILSEALVLTGHNEEAFYYFKEAEKYRRIPDYKEKGYYQNFDLLKVMASYKLGQHRAALKILERINPVQFYFLARKYKSIIFLTLVIKLKRKSTKIYDQLNALIDSTGFSRFREVIK